MYHAPGMIPTMRQRTAGLLVIALMTAGLLVLVRTIRFGWTGFGPSMVPFVVENLIPLVNFAVLLLVIIGLQVVRDDLKQRLTRFDNIETTLKDLEQRLEQIRQDVNGHD